MSARRNLGRIARRGVITVDTAQDLRDLTIYGNDYPTAVETLGALVEGDGGDGLWIWDSTSTLADNLGTVLLPTGHTGSGRWIRVYSGAINVRWFGAIGGGVNDDSAAVLAACNYGNTLEFFTLYFPTGIYKISPPSGIDPSVGHTGLDDAVGAAIPMKARHSAVIGDGQDATRIMIYGPGGGPSKTDFEVNNGLVWRGHGIVFAGGQTADSAQEMLVQNITLDGTNEYTGNHSFPADTTTGEGWDLTQKPIATAGASGNYHGALKVLQCTVKNFNSELVYALGGKSDFQNFTINNNKFLNTDGGGVAIGGGILCDNYFKNNSVGVESESYEADLFVIGNTFDTGLYGAAIRARDNATFGDHYIKGNVFRNYLNPVLVQSGFDEVIEDNSIEQVANSAIVVTAGERGVQDNIRKASVKNNSIFIDQAVTQSTTTRTIRFLETGAFTIDNIICTDNTIVAEDPAYDNNHINYEAHHASYIVAPNVTPTLRKEFSATQASSGDVTIASIPIGFLKDLSATYRLYITLTCPTAVDITALALTQANGKNVAIASAVSITAGDEWRGIVDFDYPSNGTAVNIRGVLSVGDVTCIARAELLRLL